MVVICLCLAAHFANDSQAKATSSMHVRLRISSKTVIMSEQLTKLRLVRIRPFTFPPAIFLVHYWRSAHFAAVWPLVRSSFRAVVREFFRSAVSRFEELSQLASQLLFQAIISSTPQKHPVSEQRDGRSGMQRKKERKSPSTVTKGAPLYVSIGSLDIRAAITSEHPRDVEASDPSRETVGNSVSNQDLRVTHRRCSRMVLSAASLASCVTSDGFFNSGGPVLTGYHQRTPK
jgi:hypothetical protein